MEIIEFKELTDSCFSFIDEYDDTARTVKPLMQKRLTKYEK